MEGKPRPNIPRLGLGIAWRPGLADAIERQKISFSELHAENFMITDNFAADDPLPDSVQRLQARGVTVIPHSVTLNLGGAQPPLQDRVDALAALVKRVNAPIVSDHCCFVRGGGYESGHLLPVAKTRAQLEMMAENVRLVKERMPVPLAIENIAALFEWPGKEMDEATFLGELVEMTDSLLLIDVANLYANSRNLGWDPAQFFDKLPLERLAYCHMAGGMVIEGLYHDTHSRTVSQRGILDVLEELAARVDVPGVLIERDEDFPGPDELAQDLHNIQIALTRGKARREAGKKVVGAGAS
ncbi:MAG TPA: DUF692 domain-containing protein [Planctomycetota bacterium]|nr:DUF692 domain-containing protein [Planctomycetota bacterium]